MGVGRKEGRQGMWVRSRVAPGRAAGSQAAGPEPA